MKKIPLLSIILLTLLVMAIAGGVFFISKFSQSNKLIDETSEKITELEAMEKAQIVKDFDEEKDSAYYSNRDYYYNSEYEYDIYASYTNKNIEFISFSEEWDENKLKLLCDELYKNKHGDEIEELSKVLLYNNGSENLYYFRNPISLDYVGIGSQFYEMTPKDFQVYLPYIENILELEYGYYDTTPESMAPYLAYEYGKYFTMYYFGLDRNEDDIKIDEYYGLRYYDGCDFMFTDNLDDSTESWEVYFDNRKKYLIEIAAYDYVYLMGSSTSKNITELIDSQEELRLSKSDKTEELDIYSTNRYKDSFNTKPHINLDIPLPDQVKGLAELFYDSAGLDTPEFVDHTEKVQDINIIIKKQSEHGKIFYIVTWDTPWKDEDVKYTLVSYKEGGEFFQGVKTINGGERARAIIGGAIVQTSANTYSFYDGDEYSDEGFLTFKVIVTFPDGTAAISPRVDWSFE